MNDLQSILEQFGVQGATLEPLGDTQNTNHVVTTITGERYLLRQHQSDNSLAALESEMIWLNHLHYHGLEVQRPVSLATGKFIFVTDTGRFSLLTWIDGEVVETLGDLQAEALGALMAGLHIIAQEFKPPPNFERLRYDRQYLEQQLNALRGLEWLQDDLPLFERAMTRAKAGFEDAANIWSLIHADLHPGNVIVQGSKVAVIDFDRCGFGPIAFDIVTALGYLEGESRTTFLRGYSAVLPLPENFEEQRGAFTIAEWLTNLAFLAPRPQDREFVDTVMLPGLRQELPKLLEK